MDQIRGCVCFAFANLNNWDSLTRLSFFRHLLAAHRTACLRHDEIGQVSSEFVSSLQQKLNLSEPPQATLLNLLLRNFIHYNLYDQASKLVSKTTFPESASNNQFVRYLFYRGTYPLVAQFLTLIFFICMSTCTAKILAVQLDYSDAHTMLQQCVRKAPQAGNTAIGFRIEVI